MRPRFASGLVLASIGLWSLSLLSAQQPAATQADAEPASAKEALQRLGFLVGDWRGVGQPRRGSSKGAWKETTDWAWDFHEGKVALVQKVADGQLTREARLEYDAASKLYRLTLTSPDAASQVYTGRMTNSGLVLDQAADAAQVRRRITLTPRGDIRLVALHEATEPGRDLFFRVAEIGYTREGQRLALPGGGQPQCVVTGGLGTIEVTHKGETYYVCCTGCKQAFDDDPEKILAEYRERIAEERKKAGC
jgi:hypothetical protein